MQPEPGVCVVIPAHRAGPDLASCLAAVAALEPAPSERIVVADGGDPEVVAAASRLGFATVSTPAPSGPAAARNLGVAGTSAEVILFVDSDVTLPPDILGRLLVRLHAAAEVAAVFGSYDRRVDHLGLVARFKNLLHHWTHQHAAAEASTFWTGFGAVRRRAFEAVGGFDEGQCWLEDVELGYRLRAAGHRILAAPELQVTHLKRWSLRSMLVSDVCHRAWPWTELIHRYGSFPADLNLSWRGRASVALAGAAPVAGLAALVGGGWVAAVAAATAVSGLVVLNRRFYRLLAACGGPGLALAGVGLHWLSMLAGGAAFAVGTVHWWLRGRLAARRVAGGRPPRPPAGESPDVADP